MSLLVCLLGKDGLVLATDSRGTFGDPRGVTAQNDKIQKLYVANERVAILVAGAGDLGSTVVSGFLALAGIAGMGVTELTAALHRYAREQFRQWFDLFAIKPTGTDSRPTRPDLNFIVGGFDMNQDPKIYRMSSGLDFAPMLHNYGFGVDGVAQYALYLLNRLYDGGAAVEDLQCLAAYLIAETASQDGKVGGAVQMATITKQGSRVMKMGTVAEIVVTNEDRSLALKKSFLKHGVAAEKGLNGGAKPVKSLPVPSVEEPPTSDISSGISEGATEGIPRGVHW